ncbi:PREDICTED: uncharacterized protein LOC107352399 [Acropora digitifera]|uniref:uncharacterized protein LOC107352399 n=1 Tax=Acropora digitifera TaxID=70779 RepID=UPI00077A0BDC|nr:PREDICTED: uncharacterized protein LOC107352399 [Acropora digitifera]
MFDFDDGCSWTWISDSIRGLPMRIWKGATAGARCFANGQAAHYRRIAVLRVLKSCGLKLPAFPFLGFAYACTNVSPLDVQEREQKTAKVQSWIQGYVQAVRDLQNF